MHFLKYFSLTICIGGALALSGCASTNQSATPEDFPLLMAQSSASADALLEKGDREEATKVLGELAKKYPDRKDPWVRQAKIYFDGKNYAQAIVAAEEALQRDSTDRTAKSIRAVAGLRVAAQSLADLRDDVELKGGARSDAIGLAKVMRETLGEDVLVPPDEKKKKPVPVVRSRQAAHTRSAAVIQPAPDVQAPPTASAPARGNPFGGLK